MKNHRKERHFVIAGVLGGALLIVSLALNVGSSSAGPAEPAPSADPSASASASPSGDPKAAPALPRFDAEPFSAEKSARPTPADWKPTTPVALTERLPSGCNAYRVREWVKIRCSKLATSMLAMLTGDREDVMLFADPPPQDFPVPGGGEIVFPVRRGDARVFEWSTFGDSYEGVGFPEVAFMISESWGPDEESPSIIIQ